MKVFPASGPVCWGSSSGSSCTFGDTGATGDLVKLDVSCENCVFLGYRTHSGKTTADTSKGVMRTVENQRMVMECRGSQLWAMTQSKT